MSDVFIKNQPILTKLFNNIIQTNKNSQAYIIFGEKKKKIHNKRKKIKKKENSKLEDKWIIVKKEKMSTKIKNYFKNIFSKMFNNTKKSKKKEKIEKIRENKTNNYEPISTKTKLSKGSIDVKDVDVNELDPLINLYRDSNKKLRNKIRESQNLK